MHRGRGSEHSGFRNHSPLIQRYWPHPTVTIDAEDRVTLDALAGLPGVVDYARNGAAANVAVDDLARVPDLVDALIGARVRVTKVTPHEPTLEELYFAVRRDAGVRLEDES